MEITISGFWTALVIIFVMSIFLFIATKNSHLYNTICPTTVILCGLLVLLRVMFPYEFILAKGIYIPRIFPYMDGIIRYEILKVGDFTITTWSIMLFVWSIVAAIKAFELIHDYIKMCRIVLLCDKIDNDLLAYIQEKEQKAGVTSKAIKYKISKLHGTPFIFGTIKPTIVLPFDVVSRKKDDLHMVLLHEWNHFKRKDCITKIVLETFCRFFWWLPFIKSIKRKLNEAMEIRADWNVIRNMHEDEKTQYMILLCELSEIASKSKGNIILSNTFINAQVSTMEKRFGFINDKNKWGVKNILLLAISTVIFISSYFVVLEPKYDPVDGAVSCKSSCWLYERNDKSYDIYMDGIYIGDTDDISFINSNEFQNSQIKVFKEDKK